MKAGEIPPGSHWALVITCCDWEFQCLRAEFITLKKKSKQKKKKKYKIKAPVLISSICPESLVLFIQR